MKFRISGACAIADRTYSFAMSLTAALHFLCASALIWCIELMCCGLVLSTDLRARVGCFGMTIGYLAVAFHLYANVDAEHLMQTTLACLVAILANFIILLVLI